MNTKQGAPSRSAKKPRAAVRKWLVEPENIPQRLDNFLCKKLSGVPLSRIYRAIRKGEVRINGGRVKPGYKLQAKDEVRIPPLIERSPARKPEAAPGRVRRLRKMLLLQKDGLLVFNKPPGWAVHGGSGVSAGFIETAREAFADEGPLELAHRLDRGTSGCLLIASRRSVLRELHALFRNGEVHKEYLCVVAGGGWPAGRLNVSAPLQKIILANGERRILVADAGMTALTKFDRIASSSEFSLLRVLPVTGRTHQIRVHAQHNRQPVIGDDKYGDDTANRCAERLGFKGLALHSISLSFKLGGEQIKVMAKLPKTLATFLHQFGWLEICKQQGLIEADT